MALLFPQGSLRLPMCQVCQEDRDHYLCAQMNGVLYRMGGEDATTCFCHTAGHPTLKRAV